MDFIWSGRVIQWIRTNVSITTKYVLFPVSFTALGGVGGEVNLKDWADKRNICLKIEDNNGAYVTAGSNFTAFLLFIGKIND